MDSNEPLPVSDYDEIRECNIREQMRMFADLTTDLVPKKINSTSKKRKSSTPCYSSAKRPITRSLLLHCPHCKYTSEDSLLLDIHRATVHPVDDWKLQLKKPGGTGKPRKVYTETAARKQVLRKNVSIPEVEVILEEIRIPANLQIKVDPDALSNKVDEPRKESPTGQTIKNAKIKSEPDDDDKSICIIYLKVNQCDICGMQFMSPINLQRHKERNRDKPEHGADIDPGIVFQPGPTQQSELCAICNESFDSKSALSTHFKSAHSGVKSNSTVDACEMCGVGIKWKNGFAVPHRCKISRRSCTLGSYRPASATAAAAAHKRHSFGGATDRANTPKRTGARRLK